ncbi:MAG TPA: mercuric transport protein MerTP, partial [Sphingobacteriaceae bacterium]
RTWAGAGVISAFTASLCCITPISALIVGISGTASVFSWIEPMRPYLIAMSIGVLLFAWYIKLRPAKNDTGCDCETTSRKSFLQSKAFLAIITVFAVLIIAFPLYAKIFYSSPKVTSATIGVTDRKEQVKFKIQGMTCEACEEYVNNELSKVPGVLAYKTSYANHSSLVTFDKSKVDVKTIEEAINKTGYNVKGNNYINTASKIPAQSCTSGDSKNKSCCKKN